MAKTDLDKLKGSFYIYSNGEFVFLAGTKFYIFKPDGSLVACRKDLRYVHGITFLSGNRALLSCKGVYHMIELPTGSDIWSVPFTKSSFGGSEIAISPDEAYAYSYDTWKSRHFIARLDLRTHELDVHDFYMDCGGTHDILCDEEGIPCLLKSFSITIGGKQFSEVGVRMHDFYYPDAGRTTNWKTKGIYEGLFGALQFFGSTDRILCDDLRVYEPATGKSINLLENDPAWQPPFPRPSECWFDTTGRYLCVKYSNGNVIVDLLERKVVAQYAAKHMRGCLVGNEYWICDGERILRKPFPVMEDIPPQSGAINSDWFYASRPELW